MFMLCKTRILTFNCCVVNKVQKPEKRQYTMHCGTYKFFEVYSRCTLFWKISSHFTVAFRICFGVQWIRTSFALCNNVSKVKLFASKHAGSELEHSRAVFHHCGAGLLQKKLIPKVQEGDVWAWERLQITEDHQPRPPCHSVSVRESCLKSLQKNKKKPIKTNLSLKRQNSQSSRLP